MWATSKISFKKVVGFPGDLMVKNPSTNAGDMGLILGLGRSHMWRGQLSLCTTTTGPVL